MVVSSNAKVDYKMDYITVRTLEETRRVHISEIGVLMLESTAISITAYALCELLAHKVKVIFCDHQRNPYGELLPSSGSHDSTAKIRQQLNGRRRPRTRFGRKSSAQKFSASAMCCCAGNGRRRNC